MSLKIEPILCLSGVMDNYAYVLVDEETNICAVVDASEAAPIEAFCDAKGLYPSLILTTHHHDDHVGGNAALKHKYHAKIVASEIDAQNMVDVDQTVKDGDVLTVGKCQLEVIGASGHTYGHVLWYFPKDKALFTGDTLFNLCIGGLFEGTAAQMWQTLQKIKSLPDDVLFYPGHEYTRANLRLLKAEDSDASRQYLNLLSQKFSKNEALVGMPLGLEKLCNPYLKTVRQQDFVRYFAGD